MSGIFEILNSLIGLYIETLRENVKIRKNLTIAFLIIIAVLSTLLIFSTDLFAADLIKQVTEVLSISLGAMIFLFILTLTSFTNLKIGKAGLTIELEGLRKEREKIKERIEKQDDNVLDTIQLSLNQLTEYYTINLNQAKSSYRWSITAIIVGLITLVTGIWLIYFSETPNHNMAIISSISGILIEFIGASNIFIYNKSIKQLNIYFKELIKIQDTMLAIELCEGIKGSDDKKLEIREKIILALMGRSSAIEGLVNDFNRKKKSA